MSRGKYSEKRTKRKTLRVVLIVLLVLMLAAAVAVAAFFYVQKMWRENVKPEFVIEAGTGTVQPSDFLKEPDGSEIAFVVTASAEEMKTPGAYPVQVSWHKNVYDSVLKVQDTVSPVGTGVDHSSWGDLPEVTEFVTDIQDVTEVKVTFKEQPDLTTSGDKDIIVVLTDTSGNTSEVHATLHLTIDKDAPVIEGVKPIVIYEGDAVSYRKGVTVTDELDEAPVLEVDNSQVDLSKAGTYPVVYQAMDAAGNKTTVESTIEIRAKKDGFVELETIYQMADDILAKIIRDDMNKEQQVRAIYKYIRGHYSYVNHSDKSDYLQAAYTMMTKHGGDCFNYYGLSKVLLDRLEIPNIDVKKVKNFPSDSNHFWSLVSLDDGKTWYHFDTTPRTVPTDFCLVSDAVMDKFSASYRNCFNRDKSLYPATPEKSYGK